MNNNSIERRYITLENEDDIELRTKTESDENGKRYLIGYASVKNRPSDKLVARINGEIREFTETISPTAFDELDFRDVLHLVDHSIDKVVGKVGINTTVSNNERGLFYRTEIPAEGKATTIQEDLYRNGQQGLYKGASFGFRVAKGGETWEKRMNGELHRTINKIEKVVEITSTVQGAYPDAFTLTRDFKEGDIKDETVVVIEPKFDAQTVDLDFQLNLLKNKVA